MRGRSRVARSWRAVRACGESRGLPRPQGLVAQAEADAFESAVAAAAWRAAAPGPEAAASPGQPALAPLREGGQQARMSRLQELQRRHAALMATAFSEGERRLVPRLADALRRCRYAHMAAMGVAAPPALRPLLGRAGAGDGGGLALRLLLRTLGPTAPPVPGCEAAEAEALRQLLYLSRFRLVRRQRACGRPARVPADPLTWQVVAPVPRSAAGPGCAATHALVPPPLPPA
jgi:hypothetical protein